MQYNPRKVSTADLLKFNMPIDAILDVINSRQTKSNNYPPHNIFFDQNANVVTIQMAVAGFTKDQIAVTTENCVLTIKGTRPNAEETRTFIHRGLGLRDFEEKFRLAEDAIIKSVSLEHGILTIVIEKVVSNRHKKKQYTL